MHTSEFVSRYDGTTKFLPVSRTAILSFVLTCATRRARSQLRVHNSMLVHVTRFTKVQKVVHGRRAEKGEVIPIRNRLRIGRVAKARSTRSVRFGTSDYLPTIDRRSRSIPPGRASKPVSWYDIEPHLLDVVESINVKTINGTAGDILDYETHKETGLNGDRHRRRQTVPRAHPRRAYGQLFPSRPSRMYDTLMQMGRWFGFRPRYLDLCRLYTTSDLNEWFVHITQAAEELRREFIHMNTIGGTPKDYGLRVCSHPTMMVTSKVKMRNATEVQINFAGAIQETVVFGREPSDIRANFRTTEAFLGQGRGPGDDVAAPRREAAGSRTLGKDHGCGQRFQESRLSHS